MKIAIAGLGLIGGSFLKALWETEHEATGFDKGDPVDVADADMVIVALHPATAIEWIKEHSGDFKDGAIVVDTCGIKGPIMKELSPLAAGARWKFCGGHPMAGKEVSGFRNSDATLFRGASMILVPSESIDDETLDILEDVFRAVGFRRVVKTTAEHHDEMIAYTSQLCHVLSSAYLRDELAVQHDGYSAGSFRDLVRVGAPDPALWSELFLENREALLPVLDRFIGRAAAMRAAIAAGDAEALSAQLAAGRAIKTKIDQGGASGRWTSGRKGNDPRKKRNGDEAIREWTQNAARKRASESGDEWIVPDGRDDNEIGDKVK